MEAARSTPGDDEILTSTVRAGDLDVAYLAIGDGPLALCLHGFPDTPHSWRHLLGSLAASGYRAVAPWMRGYAPTAVPASGAYQQGALGSDANALHEALGADGDAVLIGHDWGATAVYAAVNHEPDRWAAAVAASVPPAGALAPMFLDYDQLKRSFYLFVFQHPLAEVIVGADDFAFIDRLWADWSPGLDPTVAARMSGHVKDALREPTNLAAAIGYYRATVGGVGLDPAYDEIQAAGAAPVQVPTLYLHGRDDGCIGVAMAEHVGAFLTHDRSRVEVMENAGHFLQVERPDEFDRLVIDFLTAEHRHEPTVLTPSERPPLPDGFVAVVKRDCPTCVLVEPVLVALVESATLAAVVSQDDPAFPALPPAATGVTFDEDLAISYLWDIETVPTLLRIEDGAEVDRIVGWERDRWIEFTGVDGLGPDLPEWRPGCGSLSVDPTRSDALVARFSAGGLASRRVEFAALEDPFEAMYDRGWSDGLPVVPPTEARVARMLEGTTRPSDDLVAMVPPDLVECTVEKVAVNAVMAGCLPEHLPVVLAALEAACTPEFNMHGLLATTFFSGPVLIVNGPIRHAIGMNSGVNALGQGNRANATIGRALQLVVRNVGGGRPGGVDRATLGSPGKLGFCFAEDEEGSPFTPLSTSRGTPAGVDAVTLFAGHGPTSIIDQKSRDPESLTRSFAAVLRTNAHPKLPLKIDAVLVISPEHGRIYRDAGWDRAALMERLGELLLLDADELVQGVGGMAEGIPAGFEGMKLPKFRDGGLLVCHAGGGAGLFSAILGGWVNGTEGSDPVTKEISP